VDNLEFELRNKISNAIGRDEAVNKGFLVGPIQMIRIE
jgi:hypothetical protein